MDLSRRDFLKLCGMSAGGLLLPTGFAARALGASGILFPLHKPIGEAHSICPYCSVGCGLVIATDNTGHVINCEGDPDHPINQGALDPKSVSVTQLSQSKDRLAKVKYRAAGSSSWEEKDWDWAISEIAKRTQSTRDATWVPTAKVKIGDQETDVAVNRTEGIAWLGGAANNGEDCYVATKLMRALGVVYLEHQARI